MRVCQCGGMGCDLCDGHGHAFLCYLQGRGPASQCCAWCHTVGTVPVPVALDRSCGKRVAVGDWLSAPRAWHGFGSMPCLIGWGERELGGGTGGREPLGTYLEEERDEGDSASYRHEMSAIWGRIGGRKCGPPEREA